MANIMKFKYICGMISFTCDYNEGAHPAILERLSKTNFIQEPGYGEDSFSEEAKRLIREAIGHEEASVFFLVGGTQTNSTVIDAVIPHYGAVIAADTGHIAVHESGAVELSGHKVITLPSHNGKMKAGELRSYLETFYGDAAWPHMAHPDMVYISFPTEYGTIYSKAELSELQAICHEYRMKFFIDGARLGYGLASPEADVTLKELAGLCDVFYIGGTKVGALCGEAVVFPGGDSPEHFFTIIKQHGALLAKGRLLGIQFQTLFTGGLYMEISRHAIEMAQRLKGIFASRGVPFYIDSPTNQQFPILTKEQMDALEGKALFEIWAKLPDGRCVTRFCTSWCTTEAQLQELDALIRVR